MKKKEPIVVPDLRVKLPIVLGLKPIQYIPFLYGLVGASLLFFTLLWPGIHKNGSMITLQSYPRGAAVYLGSERLGSTPVTAFVPRGNQTLEFQYPGLTTVKVEKNIKGRLIGSLFFPRKDSVEAVFTSGSVRDIGQRQFTDFALWNYSAEPSYRYQHPYVLSRGIKSLVAAKGWDEANKLLKEGLAVSQNDFALRDWSLAASALYSMGKGASLPSLINQLDAVLESVQPEHIQLLSEILPQQGFPFVERPFSQVMGTGDTMDIGDISFIGFEDSETFYLQRDLVGLDEYNQFLEQQNKTLKTDDLESVSDVSYLEAVEYCQWFTVTYLKDSPWIATLPSAYQLQGAIEDGLQENWRIHQQGTPLKNGLVNTMGVLWQWTDTGASAIPDLGKQAYQYPLHQVIGGSWANDPGSYDYTTRGSQPVDWSSEFLGFRMILKRKNNNG